ncbi:PCFT-like protein, partial [Mya arenaria]
MASKTEDERLLPEKEDVTAVNIINENRYSLAGQVNRGRFYISLTLVLLVFKGCEGMAMATLKQFVYAWCENNTVPSTEALNESREDLNTTDCVSGETEAQKLASSWELYLNLLIAFFTYFSLSIFGTLSDYLGRKTFLCIAIAGFAVRCLVISVVIYYGLHIAWVLLANAVDGICGSNYMISLMTYTCTADMTHRAHERVFALTVMETVIGVGKLTTEFGNGYFIHRFGFLYPMLTAAFGCIVGFCIAITFFQDTYKRSEHKHREESRLPSIKQLCKNYIGFYVRDGSSQERESFLLCMLIFFMNEFTIQGRSNALTLFQLSSPFCWSSEVLGWYSAAYIAVTMVAGCLVLKIFQQCFSDPVIACIGLLSGIGFLVVTGLASDTLEAFLALAVGIMSILPKSILRGIASSRASESLQGSLFAGLESSEMVCSVVAGPAGLSIYAATLNNARGLVFYVLAGIFDKTLKEVFSRSQLFDIANNLIHCRNP